MTDEDLSRVHRCERQLQDFLTGLLAKVPAERLAQTAGSPKWSAHENLAHLARYHEVFLERLQRILREPAPVLSRYRAEDDPAWEDWRRLGTTEVLSRLNSLREKLNRRLKALSENDFQRTAIHPRLGEMKLSMWLEFFLVHEGHHLYAVLLQAASPSTTST